METKIIGSQSPDTPQVAFLIPVNSPNSTALQIGHFFTIGRDPGNSLTIQDNFVSGRHLRIERKAQGFVVRDQNSRNGTFLNGTRITEATLSPNDKLRIGESLFVFSESNSTQTTLRSKNQAWNEQLLRIPAFASTDFAVLITGPSGSGKEVIAQTIRDLSPRKTNTLICINCGALSESLIESELFGHCKGSFTGATHDRKGAFESARDGTLFLDEIGDLPLALQPKLLRALENQEIRPVGSDKAIRTNVRIIAATHKNLVAQVRTGKFREDLFYRLNVCTIKAPALVDRMEDFDDLFYTFAKQYRVRFSYDAIESLKEHPWPGNVRELKNLVARAAAYFPSQLVRIDELDKIIDRTFLASSATQPLRPSSSSIIKDIERDMIIQRLIANHGNQRRTASELGIPKSTLHDRIRTYEIDIDSLVRFNSSEPFENG